MKTLRMIGIALAVLPLSAGGAFANELQLEIRDGFVTLNAKDVPPRQILAEWARVGQTRIVNAEKLVAAPVTLELTHVPEKQALEIVLRSASGYLAAPRAAASIGPSLFDRILIMPTSTVVASASRPVQPATTPQPFGAPGQVAPAQPFAPGQVGPGVAPDSDDDVDDEGSEDDDRPIQPPGFGTPVTNPGAPGYVAPPVIVPQGGRAQKLYPGPAAVNPYAPAVPAQVPNPPPPGSAPAVGSPIPGVITTPPNPNQPPRPPVG